MVRLSTQAGAEQTSALLHLPSWSRDVGRPVLVMLCHCVSLLPHYRTKGKHLGIDWRVWSSLTIMTFYRLPHKLRPGFLSSQNSIKRNENGKNQLVFFIEIEREKMKVINEASK